MKLPDSKKATLAGVLIFGLLGLLAGVLLIALNTDFLLEIIFVVMGIITILYNIPALTVGLLQMQTKVGQLSLILSLISIVIGFLMIFWHTGILMIILGVYMIIFPLLQILFARDKILQLKTELPKLIIGAVLLLLGPAKTLGAIFDVAGWVILILTAVYVIAMLLGQNRASRYLHKTGNRIFVDTTGDGRVDTVYVDTTGDGKADSSTPYRDGDK